MYMKANDDDKK